MTTFQPRPPYAAEELEKLYPQQVELTFVQVLLRHGERAPVSARFENAGLNPYWPYCNAAQRLRSVAFTPADVTKWNSLQWRRRLEKSDSKDEPILATGSDGEVDGLCQFGELTDKGRETTYALGERLRVLYVDQLKFMPKLIADSDMIYLRASPVTRALESVQQVFWGMYPLAARTASFPPPTIVTRTFADETIFPNEGNCVRFAKLSRAFAERAAERWNDTEDMKYLDEKLTKWMPDKSKKVAVDGHPRLSGIMDTINSTLAHGSATRLPDEFYDEKVREIIDRIGVEEWFGGFNESREYRMLGIGGLAGDVVQRMMAKIEGSGLSVNEIGGENGHLGTGRGGEKSITFALSGCHDTTLGSFLGAMGAFTNEQWPPYTSHVAIEMFRAKKGTPAEPNTQLSGLTPDSSTSDTAKEATVSRPGWFAGMLGLTSSKPAQILSPPSSKSESTAVQSSSSDGIGRRPWVELSSDEKAKLDGYYVRVRYNDRVMKIPGCAKQGRHLPGDESFCTLEAFKRIADGFTPRNWKGQCKENLGEPIKGLKQGTEEWAGGIEKGF